MTFGALTATDVRPLRLWALGALPVSPSGLWHLPCKQETKVNRRFESCHRLGPMGASVIGSTKDFGSFS